MEDQTLAPMDTPMDTLTSAPAFIVPTYEIVIYFTMIALFLTEKTCHKIAKVGFEFGVLVAVTILPPMLGMVLACMCAWLYYMVRFVLIYNMPGIWWYIFNIASLFYVDIQIKTVVPFLWKSMNETVKKWSEDVMFEFRLLKQLWAELIS